MANDISSVCVVCFKNVEIYSIGCCDHVVCFDCSTRMRVLCRQNVCSICRQEMQLVVFSYEVKPFTEIQKSAKLLDKKYNIAFTTREIQNAFYKLLEHRCMIGHNKTFPNFQALNDHMRRDHELFYCDLCLVNIKILSSERKCYSRADLALHRRKGDVDDTSHRGHPLCEFCDTRFIDNDDLFRHLRRDHLYCHFCDADGLHMYYSSYDHLREHFREEHFLCEEGSCHDEKFTPVFRTEIDLRAHRASEHSRTLGKAAAKQARTLEVEFTLKPRARVQDGRRRGPRQYDQSLEEEGATGRSESPVPVPTPSLDLNDFPSLGNAASSSTPLTNIAPPMPRGSGVMIRAVGRKGPQYDQHFPGLPSGGNAPTTSVKLNINQERKPASYQSATQAAPNVSIHVNHRPRSVQQNDFPALSSTSAESSVTSKWVTVGQKKTKEQAAAPSKPTKPPKTRDEDFPSLSSKFTTNLNFTSSEPLRTNFVNIKSNLSKATTKTAAQETKPPGDKKASTVSIVMDGTWPEPEATSSAAKVKTKKKKKGGNEDTAKKKLEPAPEKEKATSKSEKKVNQKKSSALPETKTPDSDVPHGSKPLPTAADWFGENLKQQQDSASKEEFPPMCQDLSSDNFELDKKVSLKVGNEPPPGFAPINGQVKAPPGFSVPATNGLTFTNSSGESFPIRPTFPYLPPHDADSRNLSLVTKVNEILLNDSNLEHFRKKSAEFRNGNLDADEYYKHFLQTMGEEGTSEVLHELLVLLPDIAKQQELFQVLQKYGGNKNCKNRLESCATCQQVVLSTEMKQHLANHLLSLNTWNFH